MSVRSRTEARSRRTDDLTPLPPWKQRWRASAVRRQKHLLAFKVMVGTLVSLAVSCLGATLVAYGVYSMHAPSGFVVGGILVYLLQWSHEKDREVER